MANGSSSSAQTISSILGHGRIGPNTSREDIQKIFEDIIRNYLYPNGSGDADSRILDLLGRYFIQLARRGDGALLSVFVDEGFPVNYQHPDTGSTALHKACANSARGVIRVLIGSGKLDYLLRDKQGRYASELAFMFGNDPAVARLLRYKQMLQAKSQGVKISRRPVQH